MSAWESKPILTLNLNKKSSLAQILMDILRQQTIRLIAIELIINNNSYISLFSDIWSDEEESSVQLLHRPISLTETCEIIKYLQQSKACNMFSKTVPASKTKGKGKGKC